VHLSITDDDGRIVGEMDAEPSRPWLSMLMFVSALWAADGAALVETVRIVKHVAPTVVECLATICH
jgi:hypothetical protein